MDQWKGKVALVTGANSGFGAAIAQSLAKNGLKVAGIDINIEQIQKLADEVALTGGLVLPLRCDLTQEREIEMVFKKIKENLGGVDICINNAGTIKYNSLLDGTPKEWKEMSDVNIIAGLYCAKLSTASMIERNIPFGQIINVASTMAHNSKIRHIQSHFYAATKHSIKFLTEALRQEMIEKKLNIRVACVSPGKANTDLGGAISDNYPSDSHILSTKDISEAINYILSCPPQVEINDILIRPRFQPF